MFFVSVAMVAGRPARVRLGAIRRLKKRSRAAVRRAAVQLQIDEILWLMEHSPQMDEEESAAESDDSWQPAVPWRIPQPPTRRFRRLGSTSKLLSPFCVLGKVCNKWICHQGQEKRLNQDN